MVSRIRPNVKACKVCGTQFTPTRPMQAVCSLSCAVDLSRAKNAEKKRKEARKQHLADKERVKSRKTLMREAITAFNAYIRERDIGLPCPTCGRPEAIVQADPPLTGGVWHAGHFQSTGSAPEKRFFEDNVHRQCAACNRPGGHTREQYETTLRQRLGDERVDAVLAPIPPAKLTQDDLRDIRNKYRRKRKELRKLRKSQL